MSTRRWLGSAQGEAQVTEYVFGGTWEATDVIICTIGTKAFDTVAGSTTITTLIDTLVTAWNALDEDVYPEFAGITASRSSNSLVLTADDEGIPFTCTVSTTETGGGAADAQTIDGGTSSAGIDSTACTGPNFWSVAANWSGGAVPVNSDDVVIENTDVSILYGLGQSAVTLTSLTIRQSFTGQIGLPQVNEDGGYSEYRADQLAIGATTVKIGEGDGSGSSRIKINFGSVQMATTVYNSGTRAEEGLPAILLKGTHASNVLEVYQGSVGVAMLAGEVATIATLSVGYTTSVELDAQVTCSSGVTLTTANVSGGSLQLNAGLTTLSMLAGTVEVFAGNITTVTVDGGTFYYRGTGTITTLTISDGGTVDFSRDMSTRTVTNALQMHKGATLKDPNAGVTYSAGIKVNRVGLDEVSIDVGVNRTITPS